MNICKREYIGEIISTIEDFFYDPDIIDKTLEKLQNYVKGEIPGLAQDFSLETYISNSEEFRKNFQALIDTNELLLSDYVNNLDSMDVKTKSNITPNLSTVAIVDLFHTLPLARSYFTGKANSMIVSSVLIGDGSSNKYVSTDEEISDNFVKEKNKLFNEIQEFLASKGILKDPIISLYNDGKDVSNYSHYKKVMNLLDEYFFSGDNFSLIKTYSGKKIPNIEIDKTSHENLEKLNAYNAGILLANFDTVLQENYADLIGINYNLFNNLRASLGSVNKYTLKIEGIKTEYWLKDEHAAEGSETAEGKLSQLIVSTIPAYTKKRILDGSFMEMKDFYLFAAMISDFEIAHGNKLKNKTKSTYKYFNENPSEALLWYLEEIIKAADSVPGYIEELKEKFKFNYEFAISLRNYIYSKDLNILEKEKNSSTSLLNTLAQIINNNFGASYYTYHSNGKLQLREMYKQNFNNTQMQNNLFSLMENSSNAKLYDTEKVYKDIDKLFDGLKYSDVRSIPKERKIAINNFLKAKTSIYLSYIGFDDLINDIMAQDNKLVDPLRLKTLIKDLILNLSLDYPVVKEALSSGKISGNPSGDSSVSDYIPYAIGHSLFKALQAAYLINSVIKPVMTIETLNKEKLPTFKLATLTHKDTELFEQQRNIENQPNRESVFKSLLIRDQAAILGTGTQLELVHGDESKKAVAFNIGESFTTSFQFNFLQNLLDNNNLSVLIGNYSDKSTIITKIINGNFMPDPDKDKTPISKMSAESILSLMRLQAGNFYKDIIWKVFADYAVLLDIKLSAGVSANVKKINEILKTTDIRTLSKKASDNNINLTEELHYSKYNGVFALNQLIIDNYRIFNTFNDKTKNYDLFDEFVARQEKLMLKKYVESTGSNELNFTKKFDFKVLLEKLGLTEDQFDKKVEGETESVDYAKLEGSKGLNPLLKKWMWTNALFRNEYLFISGKGEYMHPHKVKKDFKHSNGDLGLPYRGDKTDVNFDHFDVEMSGRLSSMAKRNVIFTATIETPVRKSQYGVPENINLATIDDFRSELYNISGETKKAEVHDGSSYMNSVYALMLDNSFPAKGYSGTKKQFGTLITEHGVIVKKDAENVITNSKIIESENSEIKFLNKQKQMLNLKIGSLNYKFDKNFKDQYFFIKDGVKQRINRLSITDKNYEMITSSFIDGKWKLNKDITKGKFNTLFDLWNLFGAQYSIDDKGEFNEGSNELLYQIVTTPDQYGNYPLKDAMIHVVSNISGIKAGGTNVNSVNHWTSDKDLAYFSFANRFMGPQLDATHEADASEIKEVTQVISALAQNPQTAHLAQEAYEDIANVIKKAAAPYLVYLKPGENVRKTDLYKYIAEKFVKTIEKSKGDNIAKVLIQSFSKDVNIPFSNQNFFTPFVRDVLTRMNNEFITRYYSGTGAILIPSHGIIQLYDIQNPDGTVSTLTQLDLAKEALRNHDGSQLLSNNDIITNYINQLLPPVPTTWDKIKLGDTVERPKEELSALLKDEFDYISEQEFQTQESINQFMSKREQDLKYVTLSTPDLYYKYKPRLDKSSVIKAQHKPRDLKPSEAIFTLATGMEMNLFDLDSIRLRYKLPQLLKTIAAGDYVGKDTDAEILNNLYLYIEERDLAESYKEDPAGTIEYLQHLLNKWTQRNLDLLNDKRIMAPIMDPNEIPNLFNGDKLHDIFKDAKSFYNETNTVELANYKFNPAELILGDIYKSKFGRDEASMYEIKKQGANYFRTNLEKNLDEDKTQADIKLYVNNLDSPIYIRYTDKLPGNDYKFNISLENPLEEDGTKRKFVRRNQKGEIVYVFPSHESVRVKEEDGKEIIYIKTAASTKIDGVDHYDKDPDFEKNLNELLRSFKDNIAAFIPLMNGKFDKISKPKAKNKPRIDDFDINRVTLNSFRKFSGYTTLKSEVLTPSWFIEHREDIISQLSKKMYASWEKSHEFVAARIPAQSMQSFMEMKNVAYMRGKSNDAYVSIWQIWLQGSDFDIDKAYILGTGFNSNGQFDSWSPLANYSSTEQLNELERFPIPSGLKTVLSTDEKGLDLSKEINQFFKVDIEKLATSDNVPVDLEKADELTELSVDQLKVLNAALRKIKALKLTETSILGTDNLEQTTEFLGLINRHNMNTDYVKKEYAIINSVVSRIKQIISAPSNQLLANIPVDVQIWHDAANMAIEKKGTINDPLSSYDMFSYFKQQRDAAVGKDDVGIAANGLKVLFALSSYYNNYYDNSFNSNLEELRRGLKIFKKEFTFIDPKDPKKTTSYRIGTIADINISKTQSETLKTIIGNFETFKTNAAVSLSGFTSAATDNAKELLMAKVNATAELASMHIYLMILGFTPNQVADIMTNPIIDEVIKEVETNMFYNSKSPFVAVVFNNLIKKYTKDEVILQNVKTLKEIFDGAQEVKLLAKLLGANQKTKANTEEVNAFLTNFETIIYSREHQIFGDNLKDFAEWNNYKNSVDSTKAAEAKLTFNKLVETIFENNKHLDIAKDKKYVEDILNEASNIVVTFTDKDGIRHTDTVSLLGGKFDYRFYVDSDNEHYRAMTKKYYNLIKNTFNIFDVIEEVPHFKEMINGIVLTHNLLLNSSVKYNVAFTILKDTIRKNAHKIVFSDETNRHIKNQMGNSALYPKVDTKIMGKGLVGIDIRLKSEWLQSDGTKNLTFNVTALLKQLNALNKSLGKEEVKNFLVYTSDEARNKSQVQANSTLVTADDAEPTIISLDTNYGIANFKRLMENILLPLLQNKSNEISNVLLDSFRIQEVTNILGIRTSSIVSSFGLSSLNNAVSQEKAQKLIKAFNDADVNNHTSNLVKNSENKPLRWRDLFYVYNLLLNNERYGDLRLTPLFEDYMKERDSLGYDYVMFSAKIDSGELNLFDLTKAIANDPKFIEARVNEDLAQMKIEKERIKRELENDLLFYALNSKGQLSIKGETNGELKVDNGDFVVITSLTETQESKRSWVELNDVMKLISQRGFIIKFECK